MIKYFICQLQPYIGSIIGLALSKNINIKANYGELLFFAHFTMARRKEKARIERRTAQKASNDSPGP